MQRIWVPEGWYISADEAAYAFGVAYNAESIKYDVEIGTGIYSKTFYFYDGQYRLISEISRLHSYSERSGKSVAPLNKILNGIDKITLFQYGEPIYGGIGFDGEDYFKYVDIQFVRGYGEVVGMVHTHGNFSFGGEEFFSEINVEDDRTIIYNDKGMAFLYRTYGIKYEDKNPEKGIEEFASYLVNPLGQLKKHIPSTDLYDQGNVIIITSQCYYLGYEIPAYNKR